MLLCLVLSVCVCRKLTLPTDPQVKELLSHANVSVNGQGLVQGCHSNNYQLQRNTNSDFMHVLYVDCATHHPTPFAVHVSKEWYANTIVHVPALDRLFTSIELLGTAVKRWHCNARQDVERRWSIRIVLFRLNTIISCDQEKRANKKSKANCHACDGLSIGSRN